MIEIIRTDHKDGWIPTHDQEPPEDHILVTLKWSEDDYEVTEIDYGVINAMNDPLIAAVVAWMPMPEPYREEI